MKSFSIYCRILLIRFESWKDFNSLWSLCTIPLKRFPFCFISHTWCAKKELEELNSQRSFFFVEYTFKTRWIYKLKQKKMYLKGGLLDSLKLIILSLSIRSYFVTKQSSHSKLKMILADSKIYLAGCLWLCTNGVVQLSSCIRYVQFYVINKKVSIIEFGISTTLAH